VILHVIVWPRGSGKASEYLDSFDAAYLQGEIPQKPSARKIGDDALWWGDGLAVRIRDFGFGVSIAIPDADLDRPGLREEQLATLIADRIASLGGVAPRTKDR
jgi:hypothetical protein